MSSLQFFPLFDQQISKSEWKAVMSNAVHSYIEATWRAEVSAKASLKYVNPDSLKVGKAHPAWATVRNTIFDNKRAHLKCKVLTGTSILQGHRAAFNQYTVDATCKLCLAAPETRHHFIAEYPAYALEREVYVEKLRNNTVLPDSRKNCLTDPDFFTQLTLDASVHVTEREDIELLELCSREYIEKIYRTSIARLNHISQC